MYAKSPPLTAVAFAAAAILGVWGGCGGDGDRGALTVDVGFDEARQGIDVILSRGLRDGERLHARIRQGEPDTLDCGAMASAIPRIDSDRNDSADVPTYRGPAVSPSVFEDRYDTSWLEEEPTPEMLAELEAGQHLIDICVMKDGVVSQQHELDVRRALDQAGTDGKFDGDDEERIASTEAYAEACVAVLGEIPFFEPIAAGDYASFDCLEGVPIPMVVTNADGSQTRPETEVAACDDPQYIYSSCEPNAVTGSTNGPRVNRRVNEQGTHWVLLCRKAKADEGSYNDIAMIGHNPFTGDTCYFQNALYSRTDGLHVPHPGDRTESEASPERSLSLWSGIQGGIGSGIECAKCHDSDPFIHTPWIDGATLENGDPVVPKMGIDEDFALGYNDAPYKIVNARGQGWSMPQQIVSEEAAACTKCHRIGNGRWASDWFNRLEDTDDTWRNKVNPEHREFAQLFWMPPDVDGLDADSWQESEFAKAMDFIRNCTSDPTLDGCEWEKLPEDALPGDGGLPEIDLEGRALAIESLRVLGAPIKDASCTDDDCASRRCAECHAVSNPGLRSWARLTDQAWDLCGLGKPPAEMSAAEATAAIDCLRAEPGVPESPFAAERLGILSTGVQYGEFRGLFQKAHGESWLTEYTRFKRRVGMPKGSHPKLSQREYAVLVKWFKEDLGHLDGVLDEPPPPSSCEPILVGTKIASHLENMRFDGWGAVNEEAGISMLGCPAGGDPSECHGSAPDRTANWGAGLGAIKELREFGFRTSFWTRTSADGRFVGNGGGNGTGATITDLLTGRDIGVEASYDPGFFPDNSGFIFQGATGGAGICAQSMLINDDHVDFTESACIKATGINLYQHVARGVSGGDYFVINSQFTSDPGGGPDPAANFSATSTIKLTPMLFDGTRYDPLKPVIVESPFEGDSVLSPSSQLVVSRLAGTGGKSLGYVVRKLDAKVIGNDYIVDIDEHLATICMSGAKANFSFDERFMVTHHYDSGGANISLIDLADGQIHAVTDMPEGYSALFPHFVSNGWFYFLIQGPNGERRLAASSAALSVAG